MFIFGDFQGILVFSLTWNIESLRNVFSQPAVRLRPFLDTRPDQPAGIENEPTGPVTPTTGLPIIPIDAGFKTWMARIPTSLSGPTSSLITW